jgi:4-amino-4-deoxy-L-arabinose transferase-like glycosyltransferase
VSEVTGKPAAGILAAFVYGIIPIQVIYSHFMRTYSLSNFLCALVIWFSIKTLRWRYWLLFFATGIVAGLAAATRYPAGAVICIPCALVLFQQHGSNV